VRRLSFILLASAILLHSFSGLLTIAGYEININYISRTLCENRHNPSLHCNGKCYLKKELKKEKEQNPASSPKEKQEITPLFQTGFDFTVRLPASPLRLLPGDIACPAGGFHPFIFHPPAV
jgi:hypothetical protein